MADKALCMGEITTCLSLRSYCQDCRLRRMHMVEWKKKLTKETDSVSLMPMPPKPRPPPIEMVSCSTMPPPNPKGPPNPRSTEIVSVSRMPPPRPKGPPKPPPTEIDSVSENPTEGPKPPCKIMTPCYRNACRDENYGHLSQVFQGNIARSPCLLYKSLPPEQGASGSAPQRLKEK